jgi:hypothetical protein
MQVPGQSTQYASSSACHLRASADKLHEYGVVLSKVVGPAKDDDRENEKE